jgi:subtilisin-like proprotein convertase family protein
VRVRKLLTIGALSGVVVGAAAVAGASATVTAAPRVIHQSTSILSTPDGDPFAEKGERVEVAVEIRNVGDAPATGITATLSSTTVQYPDLAPGASARNGTPFVVGVPHISCGDGSTANMPVNTGQGRFTVPVVIPVSAVGRPESWTSTTPVDIPDLSAVESPLTLGSAPISTILDLNVRINDLSHAWVGDLVISLVRPDGREAPLATRRGFGANFTNTVFDDEANTALADGSPPFTGSFRPEFTLSSPFDGGDATGTWKLRIRDFDAEDTGRLNSWSIDAVTARCNEGPVASFAYTPLPPFVGKPVTFRARVVDPDSQIASQEWDFDNDGEFDDASGPTARRTFSRPGPASVGFRAVDDLGNADIVRVPVRVVRICRVPRVIGQTLPRAVRGIVRTRCRVGRVLRARSRRVRRVIWQSPRGGVQRPQGTRVHLVVGRR